MSTKLGLHIASTGAYLPQKTLTNADLERMVDTSDEWIITRTGIRERRLAGINETTADLATQAARDALDRSNIKPEDIDLIIAATITPEAFFPSTACQVQHNLGASKAAAFDLSAACSGFLYGLIMADGMIRSGSSKTILLIGVERLSSVVDWNDRNTCVLFGDGAGAVLLTGKPKAKGLLAHRFGADGQHQDILFLKNSQVSENLNTFGHTPEKITHHTIQMSGKEVFKQAVNAMAQAAKEVMEQAGCTMENLRCVITHQANIRIIDALAHKLKIPPEKCFSNVQKFGNISAACIPIALREAEEHYQFKRGDKILLVAFGGGLTWASTLIEW